MPKATKKSTIKDARKEPKITLVIRPAGKVARLPKGKRTCAAPWWPDVATACVTEEHGAAVLNGWSVGIDTTTSRFRERFLRDVVAQWCGVYGTAWKLTVIAQDGTTTALQLV